MSIFIPNEHGELTALEETAAEVAQTTTQIPAADMGLAFAKMLISLTLIVVLLLVSYWLLKRLIQNRIQKGVGEAAIQIIEKRMISPKTMLYIIEVENKRILIAESHLEIKRLEDFKTLS